MISLTQPVPLQRAVDSVSNKTPLGLALRTAEIEGLPVAIRHRAFFSATIEEVRMLEHMQRAILRRLRLERRTLADGKKGTFQRRDQFLLEMQKLAESYGLRPTDKRRGGLQDIGSYKRLGLIWDTQVKMAHGYSNWKMGQHKSVLKAAPAQELIRVYQRERKRDWQDRWLIAMRDIKTNAVLTDSGRMLALKNDPIWEHISRFKQPWPPFDFNSGMGLKSINRKNAEYLGLIKPGEPIEPIDADFNHRVEASLKGISPAGRQRIISQLEGDVEIHGDKIKLIPIDSYGGKKHKGKHVALPFDGVDSPALKGDAKPVKSALSVKTTGKEVTKEVDAAMDAVGEVHTDGVLPKTPIKEIKNSADGRVAGYRHGVNGKSQYMTIAKNTDLTRFAVVHETGHWLDNYGLHTPNVNRLYASWGQPEMKAVMEAIRRTPTYRKLEIRALETGRTYWLRPQELWARAYAQYITAESKDKVLRKSLSAIRRGEYESVSLWKESQWNGVEFASVKRAIRKLFKTKGWVSDQ